MLREIQLYGALGKKYGRRHRLAVHTPAEALRALEANFPGFSGEVLALGEKGYGYRVLYGRKGECGIEKPEELNGPISGAIKIIPQLYGAKKAGVGQIFAAVVLIAASVMMPALAISACSQMGYAVATGLQSSLMMAGVSMAVSGVIQLLSPMPKISGPEENKRNPSYLFDGPINTMAQGHPVPVGYGEMVIGSSVVSAGIEVDQLMNGDDGTGGGGQPQPSTDAPTLVWDNNRDGWFLPDNTMLLYDERTIMGGEFRKVRENWRTEDGRKPYLNTDANPPRWDIPNPTETADWKEVGKSGIYKWYMGGYIEIKLVGSRFEVPKTGGGA